MSFTFNTFYFIYKILYTDIVPPQKTKTIQTADYLKAKTVSVLTKPPPPTSPTHPHLLHLNYTTPLLRIVEQIVNILQPAHTLYLQTPSSQIQISQIVIMPSSIPF